MSEIADIHWMAADWAKSTIHAVRTDTRRRYSLCGVADRDVGSYDFDLDQWRDAAKILSPRKMCGTCLAKAMALLAKTPSAAGPAAQNAQKGTEE